ncbi:SMC family ATPase [archaeon]|nr:SMC family ATPase [archaeon]MBT6762118.1 SMC family ATPase [archaeon]
MLLQSINLNNVRSYQDQTIHFQEGITLLSGDIGSGKSSILLAIEFALFGAARPDLPAESLLRKGAQKASVTLNFKLGDQPITIHRTLQKTKDSVKQGAGYIIQNNQKFELTTIELKAKIIELLGYPEDQISKGKNYIYRYTIYCPQEEMKHILMDSPDNRLDILRKIFNIEKYKQVRENTVTYLKTIRKEITVLQTRSEQLPQKEQELLVIQDNLANQLNIFTQQSERTAIQSKELQDIKLGFLELKEIQKKRQSLIQEQKTSSQLFSSLKERESQLITNLGQVVSERKSLLVDNSQTVEGIEEQIKLNSTKLQSLQTKKQSFETTSSLLQKQIQEIKSQVSESAGAKEKLSSLTSQIQQIQSQISLQDSTKLEKEQVDQNIKNILQQKASIQTHINQLTQKESSFSELTHCPTCEQDVPHEHHQLIKGQLDSKKSNFQLQFQSISKEEQAAEEKQLELNQTLQKITRLSKEHVVLLQEQATLQALKSQFDQLRDRLKQKVIENNSIMSNFQEFLSLEFPLQNDLQKRITSLQKCKEQLLLSTQLQKQQLQIEQEQLQIQEKIQFQQIQQTNLSDQINQIPNNDQKVLDLENTLELKANSLETEKISLSKIEQNIIHQKENREKLSSEIIILNSVKSSLQIYQERSRWINSQFIPLTQHIEKEIMFKIYQYCNELFSDWFELLTEGSELSASLDSAFTPVITQQGHQINFTYLSGGERTAASLAYRLALTKAVNGVLQQMKTKELLILDEPTDGFSAEQLQRLRDCLESIGLKQIIIVSHEAMMEGFVNHIINVEKRSGVSLVTQ